MNPQNIKTLLDCADAAENQNLTFNPIVLFVLKQIVWETLRTRMLAVAARYRGRKMADAYRGIGKRRISTNEAFADCLGSIAV